MMLYPSEHLNEIDASLQKLLIGNQKCHTADNDDDANNAEEDMIRMCRPRFTGDTIRYEQKN